MGHWLIGFLALGVGLAYLVWPDRLLAFNDRLSLFPNVMSRGFVIFMGILAILIGVFLVCF